MFEYKWKTIPSFTPYWNGKKDQYNAKFKKVARKLSESTKSHLYSYYAYDLIEPAKRYRLFNQLSALEQLGFSLVDVPPEGDCFYECISLALDNGETAQ
jgi:hypothetical protein